MKKWMQKLVEQLEIEIHPKGSDHGAPESPSIGEDRATLLFILDTLNQHLIEVEGHPARGVRATLDEFSRELLQADDEKLEKVLFRLRQYLHSFRIAETSYVQKTFDDFRAIIWDFVDQLGEDLAAEKENDLEIRSSLHELREAVEANSIETLKSQSRAFIDRYTEIQTKKDRRREGRLSSVRRSLDTVKKQLHEANSSMRQDHLTKALNRKSFEEQARNLWNLNRMYDKSVTLIVLDIDHFKKINDSYGHDIGDYILIECVKLLKECFSRDVDTVSRVGGEEFSILLPDFQIQHAQVKAETALQKIRSEVFVKDDLRLQFTVSMGIAELQSNETVEHWIKRADIALYDSKQNGRNRYTVAPNFLKKSAS